jgi:hypothetical protein
MVSTALFPDAWAANRERLQRHLAERRTAVHPTLRDLLEDLFAVVVNPYMKRHRLPLWDVSTITEADPSFDDFRLFVIESATDPPTRLFTRYRIPDGAPASLLDICAALLDNCRVPFED